MDAITCSILASTGADAECQALGNFASAALFQRKAFSDAAELETRVNTIDVEHVILSQLMRLSKHVELVTCSRKEVARKVTGAANSV